MKSHHDMSNQPEPTDAQLATSAQIAMRDVVRALPEESLSMAWRSGLNEALLAEGAKRQRRRRFLWLFRPAAGLAMAGALAAVFVIRTSTVVDPAPKPTTTPSLEAELLSAHNQVSQYADVAGSGVRPTDAAYASRDRTSDDWDWTEVDIESL